MQAPGRLRECRDCDRWRDRSGETYSYAAADHTFEVDQDGPGVSFSIADEAEITNNSPFVKVSFDDDEYPGDSYTDVSLTAATLTMGDDEADISGDFAVEANGHNYLWAGVNLGPRRRTRWR